ncbi:MAG: PKD domain-containing protein [Candidatus Thermoplasmatota archaeon]
MRLSKRSRTRSETKLRSYQTLKVFFIISLLTLISIHSCEVLITIQGQLCTLESLSSKQQDLIYESTSNQCYYLRDDDPIPGQHSRLDFGLLLQQPPETNERTECHTFIIFKFTENETHQPTTISNIYYHIWQHKPDEWSYKLFGLGYSTLPSFDTSMNESIGINTDKYHCMFRNYRLITALQHTNSTIAQFSNDTIYNFFLKMVGIGPKIICYPDQYSFVIFNVDNNETLRLLDSDSDRLNDYEELFVYCTNPYDSDTDNDSATDYEEVQANAHGFINSNPNNPTDTTLFRLINVTAETSTMGYCGRNLEFYGYASGGISSEYRWLWDFGDGTTSDQQNPIHCYLNPGNYTVRLLVRDLVGNQGNDTAVIIIYRQLTVTAGGPYTGIVTMPIELHGSVTGGKPPYAYQWDFGDGTTSIEEKPTPRYSKSGTYTILFTVTDSGDQQQICTNYTSITIDDHPLRFQIKPRGFGITLLCYNIGSWNLTHITCTIAVNNGFIYPKECHKSFNLTRNTSIKIVLPILGLGKFDAVVTITHEKIPSVQYFLKGYCCLFITRNLTITST